MADGSVGEAQAFPSMAALRRAHFNMRRLLSNGGKGGTETRPTAADIRALIERARATGAVLSDENDRKAAQGILDYWSTELVSLPGAGADDFAPALLTAFQPTRVAPPADEWTSSEELPEDESRKLIRHVATARMWIDSGRQFGYLLLDKAAIAEAARFRDVDPDVAELVAASEVALHLRRTKIFASIIVAAVVFALLVWIVALQSINLRNEQRWTSQLEKMQRFALELFPEIARPLASTEVLQRKATELVDQIKSVDNLDPRSRRLKAEALLAMSSLRELINAEERLAQAKQARAIIVELPQDRETRFDLARSYYLIGAAYAGIGKDGDYERAKSNYEEAVKTLTGLLNEPLQGTERKETVLLAYEVEVRLGDLLLFLLGNPSEARNAFTRALEIREDQKNDDAPLIRDRAWVNNKLADVHRYDGQDTGALQLYSAANDMLLKIGDHIWSDPQWDPHWPETLGIVQGNIGIQLRKQRLYSNAEESLHHARDIFEELSKRLPHNIEIRSYLGWVDENLGETIYESGMHEKKGSRMAIALDHLQRAENTWSGIVILRPDNPEWKGYLLSTQAFIKAAQAAQHQYANEFEAAALLFDEAVELNSQVVPVGFKEETIIRTLKLLDAAASSWAESDNKPAAKERLEREWRIAHERSCRNRNSPSPRCHLPSGEEAEPGTAVFTEFESRAEERLRSIQ